MYVKKVRSTYSSFDESDRTEKCLNLSSSFTTFHRIVRYKPGLGSNFGNGFFFSATNRTRATYNSFSCAYEFIY